MKKLAFIFSIIIFVATKLSMAQQQINIQQQSLNKKTQNDTIPIVNTSFLDEGTNNPENTGSRKVIINNQVFYIKESENIRIEYKPKN